MSVDIDQRLQNLEEKFEYQERTVDALNEVLIEQQSQLSALEDQLNRLQVLFAAAKEPPLAQDPEPPHY